MDDTETVVAAAPAAVAAPTVDLSLPDSALAAPAHKISLEEFLRGQSKKATRPELYGAFHAVETAHGRTHHDTEANFTARMHAFLTEPVPPQQSYAIVRKKKG
jgi:hypothetical protein